MIDEFPIWDDHMSLVAAELEMAQAALRQSALTSIQIKPLDGVAGDAHVGDSWDILEQPPRRPCLGNYSLELSKHFQPVARWRCPASFAEILAGGSADNAIELPGRRMERADVAAPKNVRAADDAESFGFKGFAEHVYAGKNREN